MPPALERCDEPDLYDFQGEIFRNHSLAERENVAVVVLPPQPGRLQIPTKRAADASHFVGDDRFAISRSAEHNATFTLPSRHRFRRGTDEERIVDWVRAERPKITDFVPERSQKCLYFFFVLKSSVIGTDGYFQGPQHRAREIRLSRAEVPS